MTWHHSLGGCPFRRQGYRGRPLDYASKDWPIDTPTARATSRLSPRRIHGRRDRDYLSLTKSAEGDCSHWWERFAVVVSGFAVVLTKARTVYNLRAADCRTGEARKSGFTALFVNLSEATLTCRSAVNVAERGQP